MHGKSVLPENGLNNYFSCRYGTSDSYAQMEKDLLKQLTLCCRKKVYLSCRRPECLEHREDEDCKYTTYQKCQTRVCTNPACISYRKYRTLKRYEPKVKMMSQPRFITLTIQGYRDEVKREYLDFLNASWKSLSQFLRRKNQMWRYIKAVEIVENEFPVKVDSLWEYRYYYFYHIHVIYDGKFIPFVTLQKKWKDYTKGSWRVRIERVKSRFKIRSYISKYVSKGSQLELSPADYLRIRKCQFFSSHGCSCKDQGPLPSFVLCPVCGGRLTYDFMLSQDEEDKGGGICGTEMGELPGLWTFYGESDR